MKSIFKAILFGYALGLLTAPKKGKELRKDIKDYVDNVKEASGEALALLQNHSQELVEKATPAVEQIKIEGSNLKAEGEDMAKSAKELFDESYERGASALEQAEQRIREKASPALSMVKEDANAIKNKSQELLNNAGNALNEAKDKAINTFKGSQEQGEYKSASGM